VPFALGNFAGPVVLARLFDTVGRRPMIAGCYVASGALLIVTGLLSSAGALSALTRTLCWVVVFFFASAGASSAYLTVSEIFPMERRAMSIAFFYAVGTAAGGVAGPPLFGRLVETGRRPTSWWATSSGPPSWSPPGWWSWRSGPTRRSARSRTSPCRCPPRTPRHGPEAAAEDRGGDGLRPR
jgi:MFS family permease